MINILHIYIYTNIHDKYITYLEELVLNILQATDVPSKRRTLS